MRGRVGLVIIAVLGLATTPARADFFDDLGDAVTKLGDAVGDTVNDVFSPSKPHNTPAPPPPATSDTDITWNTNPALPSAPVPHPARRPGSRQTDDAPLPRAAPRRGPVSVVGTLDPLPGTVAGATVAPARPVYTPSATPVTTSPAPRPEAPLAKSFQLRFNGEKANINDSATDDHRSPPPKATPLLHKVAESLKTGLNLRLTLTSYAEAREGQNASARGRSFARASAIRSWLTQQGVRPTQIDMKVQLSPTDGGPLDRVDLVLTPDL
jgi:hypothetical protein